MARDPGLVKRLTLSSLNFDKMSKVQALISDLRLHTVCESALCPNRPECYLKGMVTFMILGDVCTRSCRFCAVGHGKPQVPDPQESNHIVEVVSRLGLKYVIITSTTRDDLSDGGSMHFAQIIRAILEYDPQIHVEVLIPDFLGSIISLKNILDAKPHIVGHNIETVPRLYPTVRPQARFERSLNLLKQIKLLNNEVITKSGFMLGLGEFRHEIVSLMDNLRKVNCDILTIGQYLQPSPVHHEVVRYVPSEEFEEYQKIGKDMGFLVVHCGPSVRSSFDAPKYSDGL